MKKIRATCGAGNNAPARSAGGGGGTTVGRGGGVTDDVITARMRAHKEGRDEALFWVLQGVKTMTRGQTDRNLAQRAHISLFNTQV